MDGRSFEKREFIGEERRWAELKRSLLADLAIIFFTRNLKQNYSFTVVSDFGNKMGATTASRFSSAALRLSLVLALAAASNPFSSNVVNLSHRNWKSQVLDSPHVWIVNVCRQS